MTKNMRSRLFWFIHTRPGFVASVIFRIFRNIYQNTILSYRQSVAIIRSREFVNFTYNLNDQSRAALPHCVAQIAGSSLDLAEKAIQELEHDHALAQYYRDAVQKSNRRWASDETFKPGRLLLHYALVRLIRPRCVFEAGLDKGHGAIIMNRALQRNKTDGNQANYVGVEFRADRPVFLLEHLPDRIGNLVYASWYDVIETLPPQSIDFLFYDAVLSAEHLDKLVTYSDRLSPDGIIVCAWAYPEVIAIAEKIGRRASIFSCVPDSHWSDGNQLCIIHRDRSVPLNFQK